MNLLNTMNNFQFTIGSLIDFTIILFVCIWIISKSSFQLFKGIVFLLLITFITYLLGSNILFLLISKFGIIAMIILLKSEIRQELENLGNVTNIFHKLTSLFSNKNGSEIQTQKTIQALIDATFNLSFKRIGALIVISDQNSNKALNSCISGGVPLHSEVSRELLENLFFPNSPLHDGAVILDNNEILVAGSVLPLAENSSLPEDAGTRHRAAIGASETSGCSVLVVSEECGRISFVRNGSLSIIANKKQLETLLKKEFSHK